MAPHSNTLAWKIPWMEEPGRLQSMGSLRVRHDWATSLSLFTFMHWRRKWQPTSVFLPGESQGRGRLVGCRLGSQRVGHNWSDLAAGERRGLLSHDWDSRDCSTCLSHFGAAVTECLRDSSGFTSVEMSPSSRNWQVHGQGDSWSALWQCLLLEFSCSGGAKGAFGGFFFGCTTLHVGSQLPDQGSNLRPLHWKLNSLNYWIIREDPPGMPL